MIENTTLKNILLTATDISIVCEIYNASETPKGDGFDPGSAIDCFAAVSGIAFAGRTYKRLVKKFGSIERTITSKVNNTSVEFSNLSREISQFEFTNGFEGLIMVIRLISRSQSVVYQDSQILFTGRCEKPSSGNSDSLTVTASFVLGSLEVSVPRRKFTATDQEGRVSTDPNFEGFKFIPQYGAVSYSVRVRRGGIAGFFGFKKTVQQTVQYSSFSDVDADKSVPEVFGRAQMLGVQIGYVDVGTVIQMKVAYCEGQISDILSERSTDSNFPLSATNYAEAKGLTGAANNIDLAGFVAPGNFSRTAHIRGQASNTAVGTTDPAPDIVAVIMGRLVTVPDGAGVWNTTAWSDDAAAHTRFLLTSSDYYKLAAAWIDDAAALTVYNFNQEQIFDTSISDFTFVEVG